ncbi:MAG TPA: hypothetical protein VF407_00250 [Polyangiaceae bacterium]
MAAKRKLPVIQSRPEDDEPPRPEWHWVVFGVVAIFVLWAPLAALAESIKRRIVTGAIGDRQSADEVDLALRSLSSAERTRLELAVFLLPALALVLAALGGGFLIGRYGAPAGVREGAFAAALAAFVACVIAWTTAGFSFAPLVAVVLAAPFGALGAKIGKRRRT